IGTPVSKESEHMTDTPVPSRPGRRPDDMRRTIARGTEFALFNSRWLMAPFYIGLVVSIAVLLLKFIRMLWEFILEAPGDKPTHTILGALSLIDMTLVANLVLIVVFLGYRNLVSRIDSSEGSVGLTSGHFAGLKQKLLASIVAISAIHVLEA